METKVRIQLFDPKDGQLSDRLVEQSTEFRKGPLQAHQGTTKIEFTLTNAEEAKGAIDYLGKLVGLLPIQPIENKKRGPKGISKLMADKEPLIELMEVVDAKSKTQEEFINNLREYEFRFVNYQQLIDLKSAPENLKDIDVKFRDRQFMVRLMKEAKNPSNDKYDFRLMYVFDLQDRKNYIQSYFYGERKQIKKPWKDIKGINFKKPEVLYSFPDYMTEDDRMKYRAELRKIQLDSTHEPSKHFKRWQKYVKALK